MAHGTADIEELLDQVSALQRRVAALARARAANGSDPDKDDDPSSTDPSWIDVATDEAARLLRAAVRERPLVALAGAFALGLCVAARVRR